jgi:hypothetical protein
MAISDLLNRINTLLGRRVVYIPYNLSKVDLLVGSPPLPIHGVQYIVASHSNPQTRRIMSLTGKGRFVGNLNQSGIIEFALQSTTVSTGILEVLNLTGVPFPISVIDRTTNGSSAVFASQCRRVGTPEWRRAAAPDLEIFTFSTIKLIRLEGVREQDD